MCETRESDLGDILYEIRDGFACCLDKCTVRALLPQASNSILYCKSRAAAFAWERSPFGGYHKVGEIIDLACVIMSLPLRLNHFLPPTGHIMAASSGTDFWRPAVVPVSIFWTVVQPSLSFIFIIYYWTRTYRQLIALGFVGKEICSGNRAAGRLHAD